MIRVLPNLLITCLVLLVPGCGKTYSLNPNASFPENFDELVETWEICEKCLKQGMCNKGDYQGCISETLPSRDLALNKAVGRANFLAVRYLVEVAGADVNGVTGRYHETPLHIAAYYRSPQHYKVAEFLIAKGAKLNELTLSGSPAPLLTAIWKDNIPVAKLLLAHGANPNVEGKNSTSACNFSKLKGQLDLVVLIPGCCENTTGSIMNKKMQKACAKRQE